MFVRSDWTRRGLGTRILEECEASASLEGFRELYLVATLPGVPLYLAYGFRRIDDVTVVTPDGVSLACVSMEKPVTGKDSEGG
jgi:N-acetylglutamate synthase-like GNAT family acetyltransferase